MPAIPALVEPFSRAQQPGFAAPGVVVSRSGFTEPAQILAGYMAPTMVLLWQGAEIELALKSRTVQPFRRGLRWKFRLAVEEGAVLSDLSTFLSESSP